MPTNRAKSGSQQKFSIVTACVAGFPAESASENNAREKFLKSIAGKIEDQSWSPDVVLLPGGYFFSRHHTGPFSTKDRIKKISSQKFSNVCIETASRLNSVIVSGVDSVGLERAEYYDDDGGDQLCVAWDSGKIIGIGRKIFPTEGEADELVIYSEDFSTDFRQPKLGSSKKGLLCACYDMFGCNESPQNLGTRSANISWIGEGKTNLIGRYDGDESQALDAITDGLKGWERLVKQANVGLVAVHKFTRRGHGSGKGRWQKHGIQNASMEIGGKLTFGACHWEVPLPTDPKTTPLAAKNGNVLPHKDHVVVSDKNGMAALLRYFIV